MYSVRELHVCHDQESSGSLPIKGTFQVACPSFHKAMLFLYLLNEDGNLSKFDAPSCKFRPHCIKFSLLDQKIQSKTALHDEEHE